MITILLPVLAAAALTAPDLGESADKRLSKRDEAAGIAVVEVLVSPDRKIEECNLLYAQYEEDANERLCRLIDGREAAEPARDADGNPIYGRAMIVRLDGWLHQAPAPGVELPAEIEIAVQDLPDGAQGRETVNLALIVDQGGVVTHCEVVEQSSLSDAACREMDKVAHPVKRNANGAAVPYFTELTVDFVASGA